MRYPLSNFRPLSLAGSLAGYRRAPDAPPTPAQVESNIFHLVLDITFWGFTVGTTLNYLQVYAVRLGASGILVATITYAPALISVFLQLPTTALLNRTGHRMRWVLASNFVHRLAYLLIVLVPFLVIEGRAELTVLILAMQALPFTMAVTSFISMLADAVPRDRISLVMSRRMATWGLTTTLGAMMAGPILAFFPFPLNYQVLFTVGFLGALGSQWQLAKLQVPDLAPVQTAEGFWRGELRTVFRTSRFVRFAVAAALLQMALGMVAPLFPLFWVRQLNASDGQISIIVTIFSGVLSVGALLMRRVVVAVGRERVLVVCALGNALYPLLTSLVPSVWWVVPWAIVGGFFNSGIWVTLFDNMLGVTPVQNRNSYISVYYIFINSALFVGPLLAGALTEGAGGPGQALRLAAGISVLSGLLLWRFLLHPDAQVAPGARG